MSTIEEAREQAREALEQQTRAVLEGYGMSAIAVNLRDALRALLDTTEPPVIQYADSATVAGLAEKIAGENAELMDRLAAKPAEVPASPAPFNGGWVCSKCAREAIAGGDDGQIPEHHRTCPKRDEPAEDEREALDGAISRLGEYVNAGSIIHLASSYRTGDGKIHFIDFDDLREVLNAAAGYSKRPRPITDEMVAAADFAIMPYWGERYPSGSLTTEIARAALEAAEAARR